MRDYDRTVVSQYTNSTKLCALLDAINNWLDPDANLEAFYELIWNLDTAVGYGLDIWGRIVGVNRVLKVATVDYFGFQEATDADGFEQAPFYNGGPATDNYALTDEAYRRLIFAKAAENITDGSIPAINAILMNLFPGRGNAYVTDGPNVPGSPYFGFEEAHDSEGFETAPFGDFAPLLPENMTLTYVFDFALQPFEIAIVTQSGVLPKPVGVLASASYPT